MAASDCGCGVDNLVITGQGKLNSGQTLTLTFTLEDPKDASGSSIPPRVVQLTPSNANSLEEKFSVMLGQVLTIDVSNCDLDTGEGYVLMFRGTFCEVDVDVETKIDGGSWKDQSSASLADSSTQEICVRLVVGEGSGTPEKPGQTDAQVGFGDSSLDNGTIVQTGPSVQIDAGLGKGGSDGSSGRISYVGRLLDLVEAANFAAEVRKEVRLYSTESPQIFLDDGDDTADPDQVGDDLKKAVGATAQVEITDNGSDLVTFTYKDLQGGVLRTVKVREIDPVSVPPTGGTGLAFTGGMEIEETYDFVPTTGAAQSVTEVRRLYVGKDASTPPNYVWRFEEGDFVSGEVRSEEHSSVLTQPGGGAYGSREIETTIREPGGLARVTSSDYTLFPWGEELTEETADPSGLALRTTYEYYDGTANTEEYGKRKSVNRPDGSWAVYTYEGDTSGNYSAIYKTYEPWLSTPATAPDPAAAGFPTGFAGRVTTWSFGNHLLSGLPKSWTKVEVGGVTISETKNTPSTPVGSGNLYTATSRTTDSASGSAVWSATETYAQLSGADAWKSGRLIATYGLCEDSSGAGLVETSRRYYHKGDIGGSASAGYTFTPNASGVGEKTVVYQMPLDAGATTSGSKISKTVTLFDGDGRILQTETHVVTSGGDLGDPGEDPIPNEPTSDRATWTAHAYDSEGRQEETYRDGFKISEIGYESPTSTLTIGGVGVAVRSERDGLGRVEKTTKLDFGGADEVVTQRAVETVTVGPDTYEKESTTRTAGGRVLQSWTLTDAAGRPVESRDGAGLVTAYSYANGGRITTTTRPDTGVEVVEYHLDGKILSITGGGVADRQHEYAVGPDGFLTTTVRVGDEDPGSPGTPSPRYTKMVADLSGRVAEERRPSISGGGAEIVTKRHWGANAQLSKIERPGIADELFVYDAWGRVEVGGLDRDATAGLQQNSNFDSYRKFDRGYEKRGGVWDARDRVDVATAAGSSTLQIAGLAYRTMSLAAHPDGGFVSSRVERFNMDAADPAEKDYATITHTVVDRGAKTAVHYTEIETPGAANPSSWVREVNGVTSLSRAASDTADTVHYTDPLGRDTGEKDPRTGRRTFVHYDDLGQIDYVIDLAGNTTRYTYHPTGVLGAGRQASVTRPDGATETYSYSATREIATVRGDASYPIDYSYDRFGELSQMHTYRHLQDTGTKATTTWVYDPATGLLTSKEDASAKSVDYVYDTDNRLERIDRATAGRSVEVDYDSAGRRSYLKTTGPFAGERAYVYDRAGRLIGVDWEAGAFPDHYWVLTYSPSGRLLDETVTGTGALGGLEVDRGLDPAGRPGTLQAGLAAAHHADVTYSHDTAGRLGSVTDGRLNLAATYVYHPNSALVHTLTFAAGATPVDKMRTERRYDSAGRLGSVRSEDLVGGGVVSGHLYEYNARGQRVRAQRHDGTYWEYGYNSRGEITSTTRHFADGSPFAGRVFGYSYDDIGNRTSATSGGDTTGANLRTTTYGNGTLGGSANVLNQYSSISNPGSFDVAGTHPNASSTANPQVPTVSAPGATTPAPSISAQPSASPYWYRAEVAVDNSAGSVYQHVSVDAGGGAIQERDEFVPSGSESPAYDDDGNLTADGRWEYAWDALNQLRVMTTHPTAAARVTATGPGGVNWSVPKRRLEFGYDYLGRRFEKKVYGWAPPSGSSADYNVQADRENLANWSLFYGNLFVYDGGNVVARYDLEGELQQTYLWGSDLGGSMQGAGGVGGLLAIGEADSGGQFVAYDGNGNVSATTSSTTGATGAEFDYDAFGRPVTERGPASPSVPFRFSTKYQDQETGYCYYGLRYYNPAAGRWISRDPIGERGGVNLYGFSENDPISKYDVFGLWVNANMIVSPDDARNHIRGIDTNIISLVDSVSSALEGWPEWWELTLFHGTIYEFTMSHERFERYRRRLQRNKNFLSLLDMTRQTFAGVGDDGRNQFVFTCKYGWIDGGHFFASAAAAYHSRSAGAAYYIGGIGMELLQGYIYINKLLNFRPQTGMSLSTFTPEDLPSDRTGAIFGAELIRADRPIIKKWYNNGSKGKLNLNSIADKWDKFLTDAGAVSHKEPEVMRILREDQRRGIGKRRFTYRQSIKYAKSSHAHKCLCDGDAPKPKYREER